MIWIVAGTSTRVVAGTSTIDSETDHHPYGQIFSLQAGRFHPTAIFISNSGARYDYSNSTLDSYLVEPGISMKLFHLLGAVYIEENLALSSFNGNLSSNAGSLSLYTMGLDTRIKHAWEWFPVHAIVPFIEGGYQYTFYSQNGPTDFESAQGSVGNFVAGAGFDIWLNEMLTRSQDHVNKYNVLPLFLSLRASRVFSNGSNVDLGSTSLLAGLGIGI